MRRFSRDAAVVEELVHDVFVEAYLSLKSYRAKAPLIHWLRQIAVRVGYRYWKRQTREKSRAVPASDVESVLEQLEGGPSISASQAHETLHELMNLLSPRDRLVLTLMYWDGCTVAEAAELAGWTKTMVRVQAHRARKRLKQLIEESRQ
jgi:RNA polymerase sigma-70 factor (ECF subfamily)